MNLVKPLIVLVLLLASVSAFALSTPNVDITDRAYKDIDILIAAKLVRPTIVGQRPYARSEFARMVNEAIKNRENLEVTNAKKLAYIDSILDALKLEFADELDPSNIVLHPLKTAKAENAYIKADMEAIPPDNGVGFIRAKLFPLTSYREGRNFGPGYQTFLETEHTAQLSKYFSVYIRPSFDLAENSKAYIQNMYAKFEVANIELQAGRDTLVFGEGQYGPLMISNNARPLDMVKLTNPSPSVLPWIFKYLGPSRFTLFVANLGPDQPFKYPYFAGYKLTIMPFHLWELDFSHTVMMGGEGAPHISFLDAIGEFTGFRTAGSDAGAVNQSNHMMEWGTSVTIPFLRYTRIYASLNCDDKRDTIKRFFKDGSAYLGGVYIPSMTPTGNGDLRLEYYHTSPIHYRHGIYTYGYTLSGNIIGSALGSDADGIHAEYHQDLFNDRKYDLTGTFDWERRGSDLFTTTTDPDGTMGDIVVAKSQPSEHRLRFGVKHRYPLTHDFTLESRVAYERIINKDFTRYSDGNDGIVSVALTYDFGSRFTYKH